MQPSIIRLGILLLLFDVYLTWARIEKQAAPATLPGENKLGTLAQQPIVLQYLFFCSSAPSVLPCILPPLLDPGVALASGSAW